MVTTAPCAIFAYIYFMGKITTNMRGQPIATSKPHPCQNLEEQTKNKQHLYVLGVFSTC